MISVRTAERDISLWKALCKERLKGKERINIEICKPPEIMKNFKPWVFFR